jgi:tetratricopeptide (TPR) repeat protein
MKSFVATAAIIIVIALPLFTETATSLFEDLVNRADAANAQNDITAAIKLYSRALQVRPNWGVGWLRIGLLKYQTGAYAGARDDLTRFITLSHDPEPAIGVRGLCEFQTREYAKSLEDIQRGLSLLGEGESEEKYVLVYHEALLLTKFGKFVQALHDYARSAQKQISRPEMFRAIGLAGLRMPLFPGELARDIAQVEATGHAMYALLAGDQEDGQRQFRTLFQNFSPIPNEHYAYGLLLFPADPEDALIEFRHEADLFPANEQGELMVAWALLMRHDADGALPYAAKAAAKAPHRGATQLVLGRALAETGKLKDGIEHLSVALRVEPGNLEIHVALAEAYSRAGDRIRSHRERRICLQLTKDRRNRIALP